MATVAMHWKHKRAFVHDTTSHNGQRTNERTKDRLRSAVCNLCNFNSEKKHSKNIQSTSYVAVAIYYTVLKLHIVVRAAHKVQLTGDMPFFFCFPSLFTLITFARFCFQFSCRSITHNKFNRDVADAFQICIEKIGSGKSNKKNMLYNSSDIWLLLLLL